MIVMMAMTTLIMVMMFLAPQGALYLTLPGDIHIPNPIRTLLASRCYIHLRWRFYNDANDDILLTALLLSGGEEEAITIMLRGNEDFAKNIARTILLLLMMIMIMMRMLVKCDKDLLKDCNNFAVVGDNNCQILPNLNKCG